MVVIRIIYKSCKQNDVIKWLVLIFKLFRYLKLEFFHGYAQVVWLLYYWSSTQLPKQPHYIPCTTWDGEQSDGTSKKNSARSYFPIDTHY